MKERKKGYVGGDPRASWPVGVVVDCPNCHWQGEIEPSDLSSSSGAHLARVRVVTGTKPGERMAAHIGCPTHGCGTVIELDRPGGNWVPVYGDAGKMRVAERADAGAQLDGWRL